MSQLVSVAIPAYNHEKFIVDCLESVRGQDYQNIELIIIDDGSKDSTPQLISQFIKTYEQRFSRVVFLSRPNRGVSFTSNECFSHARGEWVHLLGSDDLMKPFKISRMMRAYEEWGDPDVALIYSDADYIDNRGTVVRVVDKVFPPGVDKNAYRRLFLSNCIPNPTLAIRREAFEAVGGFDESLFLEDWDMWLRLSARYPIARIPEVLASYRYHVGNTHTRKAEMLEACLRSYGKFLEMHRELLDTSMISRNWRKCLHRLLRWAKSNHRALLPQLLCEVLMSWRCPKASRYIYYADILVSRRERS
jgi:alpha-1,3-rhamnosyltransferase